MSIWARITQLFRKAEAVRMFVNNHVQAYEQGIPLLANSNMQIAGLPV